MSPPAAASSTPAAAKAKKPCFADATASGTGKARKKGDKVVLQSLGSSVPSSRPSASSPPAPASTAGWTSSTAHAPSQAPLTFLATGAAPTKLPRAPISFLPGGDVSSPSPPTQAPPPAPPHAVQSSPPSPPPPPPPPAVSNPPQQEPLIQPYQPYSPYPDPSAFNPYTSEASYPLPFSDQNPYNPYDPTLVGVGPPSAPYPPYSIPLLPSSLADFSAPTPIPHPPPISASPFVGGGYDPEALLRQLVEENGILRLQQVVAEGRREATEEKVAMQKKVVELQKEVVRLKEELTARNQAFSALKEEAATSLDELLAEYETGQRAKEVLEQRVMALEAELEEGRKALDAALIANDASRRGTSQFLQRSSIVGRK